MKANAEGRLPYGMDHETAALFPDSFEFRADQYLLVGMSVALEILQISLNGYPTRAFRTKIIRYCTPLLGGQNHAWTTESLFDEPIIIGRVGTLGVVKKYTSPVWPSDNTLIFKLIITHHSTI